MTLDFRDLRRVASVAQENPDLSEDTLRWWIDQAHRNGFHKCVVRVGRNVYIHVPSLNRWLQDHVGAA